MIANKYLSLRNAAYLSGYLMCVTILTCFNPTKVKLSNRHRIAMFFASAPGTYKLLIIRFIPHQKEAFTAKMQDAVIVDKKLTAKKL
ncbi:MAG: hypothetical protein K2K52_08040 [Paramuribaculum sp.]|nr:hypothetical protein [Paramuribaculum sp.]